MNVIETVIEVKQMAHGVEFIELKTNFWNPKEIICSLIPVGFKL